MNLLGAGRCRFLELSDQTLAWMMAIDTCFLLDFLESYHRDEVTDMVSSATNWINATVRDAMRLENQLPLFLFSQALALRHPTEQAAAGALHAVLDRFIKEVSPIKTTAELVVADVARHAHMLELLYHFLVPDAAVFDGDGDREPPPMVRVSVQAAGASRRRGAVAYSVDGRSLAGEIAGYIATQKYVRFAMLQRGKKMT
jgi:hypothetical protein